MSEAGERFPTQWLEALWIVPVPRVKGCGASMTSMCTGVSIIVGIAVYDPLASGFEVAASEVVILSGICMTLCGIAFETFGVVVEKRLGLFLLIAKMRCPKT